MKANRSQIALIVLWVLVILTILAIGVGHRVSLGLRLNRYQRDGLKARYLAKAGISRAIAELAADDSAVDSFSDTWSTGEDESSKKLFENIEVRPGSGEAFTVQYLYDKEKKIYRCMEDEERKININGKDLDQLKELFKLRDSSMTVDDAAALAGAVVDWIDEDEVTLGNVPESLLCKNASFKTPEEVCVAFEYFFRDIKKNSDYQTRAKELYSKVKDIITVYTASKVNLNTVLPDALQVVMRACFDDLTENALNGEIVSLLGIIRNFQESAYRFDTAGTFNEIIATLESSGVSLSGDQQTAIIPKLFEKITIKSEVFRIESTGFVRGVNKGITAVVKRGNPPEILHWHEH